MSDFLNHYYAKPEKAPSLGSDHCMVYSATGKHKSLAVFQNLIWMQARNT